MTNDLTFRREDNFKVGVVSTSQLPLQVISFFSEIQYTSLSNEDDDDNLYHHDISSLILLKLTKCFAVLRRKTLQKLKAFLLY